LAEQEVLCRCRCGKCCERLLIEATAFDARREPRIAERGSIIDEGGAVPPPQADWLLNGPDGPCVFFRRDENGHGVCEIYDTRPLACRHFDCDTSDVRGPDW
jgi:Fe-S-cluster containining protein